MKRVLRWAFSGATLMSAVTLVAVVSLWVQSFQDRSLGWELEHITSERPEIRSSYSLEANCGVILFCFRPVRPPYRDIVPWPRGAVWRFGYGCFPQSGWDGSFTDSLTHFWHESDMGFEEVAVPAWVFFLASALLPIAWLLRWPGRHRARKYRPGGFCASCGYDLRATPNQCPECGAVATSKRAT